MTPKIPLPIDPLLPDIRSALEAAPRLVLKAPPGAGKTTRVPADLLNAPWLEASEEVWVLEPRRIAARMAAERVARERATSLGEEVGYQIRFEERASARTRLRFVTEGILTRRLLRDPELRGIGAVVLDEFHERGLETDLALALLRETQQVLRPSLRLLVMSATLDASPLAAYLDCRVLESAGRAHPVEIAYAPRGGPREIEARVAGAFRHLLDRGLDGSVLCFVPGAAEIRRSLQALEPLAARAGFDLRPLHGDLSVDEQEAAIRAGARPRVIVATNVAEASLTVEGVRAVIDTGLVRVKRYDLSRGLDRLHTERISRSSAEQRAGRAGRAGPGICLRLYSEAELLSWPQTAEPEVCRCDLSGALLQLLAWGVSRPAEFGWLTPPPLEAVRRGLDLLSALQALEPAGSPDSGGVRLSECGERMRRYPVHPRHARVLVEAERRGVLAAAADLVALAGERDLALEERAFGEAEFRADGGAGSDRHQDRASGAGRARGGRASLACDLYRGLDLLHQAEAGQFSPPVLRQLGLDVRAAHRVRRARAQLLGLTSRPGSTAARGPGPRSAGRSEPRPPIPPGLRLPGEREEEETLRSLLAGYPDRVVRRNGLQPDRGLMVGGLGVRLDERSDVREGALFLALEAEAAIDRTGRFVRVRRAARVEEAWLREHAPLAFRIEESARFDDRSERVIALQRTLYHDLPLEEKETGRCDPRLAAEALTVAALASPERALEWTREAMDLRDRFDSLALWEPALPLSRPEWLRAAVQILSSGQRSFADLRRGSLAAALANALPREVSRLLDQRAPARITLPSGRAARLEYRPGEAPVLAVRLQELFGSCSTPAVNAGRTPVQLHLLAPSHRPLQVTGDLASFWRNVYPKLRRQLRAKYPRHSWPEDPATAKAESRPGGRR